MAMHVSTPQISIKRLTNHIKQLKQTLGNKDKEPTEVHQLNVQLQARIRELEKSLEEGAAEPVPVIKRDSHNSNQPPSLDLPWIKPKRTGSLRKQSGLKIGGQIGHAGATLRQVAEPQRIIIHQANECLQCGTSLIAVSANNLHKRQVFEIENGGLAVIEHRLAAKDVFNLR